MHIGYRRVDNIKDMGWNGMDWIGLIWLWIGSIERLL
jgi:hypothetical protein